MKLPQMMKVRKRQIGEGEPSWPAVQVYDPMNDVVNWVECSGEESYLLRLHNSGKILNSAAKERIPA